MCDFYVKFTSLNYLWNLKKQRLYLKGVCHEIFDHHFCHDSNSTAESDSAVCITLRSQTANREVKMEIFGVSGWSYRDSREKSF